MFLKEGVCSSETIDTCLELPTSCSRNYFVIFPPCFLSDLEHRGRPHSREARTLSGVTAAAPTSTFLQSIVERGVEVAAVPLDPPNLYDYLELAVRGGFPEPALARSSSARARLLDGYIDQLITRDLVEHAGGRDPERVRRYFEALAANTAGIVTDKTLHDAAGVDRKTAVGYDGFLRDLFVIDELPAWSSNRLKRMTRAPKRYVSDSRSRRSATRCGRRWGPA